LEPGDESLIVNDGLELEFKHVVYVLFEESDKFLPILSFITEHGSEVEVSADHMMGIFSSETGSIQI